MPAHIVLLQIFLIGFGSAVGGNARYWIGQWLQEKWVGTFPIGIFLVNTSGAFFIGVLSSLISRKLAPDLSQAAHLLITVGFLGGYTTFSTLAFDTYQLLDNRSVLLAIVNGIGSLLLGVSGVWLGVFISKHF